MLGFWSRFQNWRMERGIRRYENTPERDAAHEREVDARAWRYRPQGSGRRTTYDEGGPKDRFS
jgi:hypothetical protein